MLMRNITPFATEGGPVVMGKKCGCLMKDDNSDMLFVHCVIHRENSVS